MAIPKEPGTNLFYDELFKWWNVRLKAAVVIELPDSGDESTDLSSVLTCVKGEEETPDSLESQLLEDPYLDGLVVESIPISPEPSSPEPPLSYVDALAAVVGEVGDDVEETKEAVEEPPKNAAAEYLQDVAPKAPDCPDLSSHETQKPICSILKLKGQDLHTLPVAVIEARIAFLKYFSCSYRTLWFNFPFGQSSLVFFPLSFSGVGSRVHLRQKLQSKNTGAVLDTAETMAFDASQAAQDFVGPDHYPDLDRSKTNDSLRRCLVQDFGVQEVEQFSGTEGQASFDKIFKCAISIYQLLFPFQKYGPQLFLHPYEVRYWSLVWNVFQV